MLRLGRPGPFSGSALAFLALLLSACPKAARMPEGPPPEYEDPPRPSWRRADPPTVEGPPDASTDAPAEGASRSDAGLS